MKPFLIFIFLSTLFSVCTQAQFLETEKAYLVDLNLLKNPGMENGKAEWTASGGALATVTSGANLAFGNSTLSWDSSANAQTLKSAQVSIPSGIFSNTRCSASFFYKTAETTLTFSVIDGSNAALTGPTTLSSASTFKSFSVQFTCPSSGTFAMKFASTVSNSAIVYLDNAFLGLQGSTSTPPSLLEACSVGCTSASSILSGTNITYSLGGTSDRWLKLWAQDADFSGNVTLGDASADTLTIPAVIASNLIPSGGGSYDLGSNANRWTSVYIAGNTDTAGVIKCSTTSSAGAPCYTFASWPTTGVYSAGASQMSVSTNGLNAITWDSSQATVVGGRLTLLGATGFNFSNEAGLIFGRDGAGSTQLTSTNTTQTRFYVVGTGANADGRLGAVATNGGTGDAYLFEGTSGAASNWNSGQKTSTSSQWMLSWDSSTFGTGTNAIIAKTTGEVNVHGTATNNSAPAGFYGEILTANSAGVTPAASGSFITIVSESLTAGDWDVECFATVNAGATLAATQFLFQVSTTNNASDSTNNGAIVNGGALLANATDRYATGARRILLSGTSTVYCVGDMVYTVLGSTTYTTDSLIRARRAR